MSSVGRKNYEFAAAGRPFSPRRGAEQLRKQAGLRTDVLGAFAATGRVTGSVRPRSPRVACAHGSTYSQRTGDAVRSFQRAPTLALSREERGDNASPREKRARQFALSRESHNHPSPLLFFRVSRLLTASWVSLKIVPISDANGAC